MKMKKIIKSICYAFLALFFVFVVVRIVMFDSSSVLSEITPTNGAKAAYAAGEEILTHKMLQGVSDDGYTRAYSLVYIPSEKEIQVTVKYNMSIYKNAGLEKGDKISFKLYETSGEKEFFPSDSVFEEKMNYGYCRVVFTGVDFDETSDLEIVMCSDDYSEDFSVYKLHEANSSRQEFEEYKLSGKEKNLLGE